MGLTAAPRRRFPPRNSAPNACAKAPDMKLRFTEKADKAI